MNEIIEENKSAQTSTNKCAIILQWFTSLLLIVTEKRQIESDVELFWNKTSDCLIQKNE